MIKLTPEEQDEAGVKWYAELARGGKKSYNDFQNEAQLKKVGSEVDIEFIINMLKQSKGYIWRKRGRDTCSKQINKLEALLKEINEDKTEKKR